MKENIGIYRGKHIHKMNKKELFEFAKWASKELEHLQNIKSETLDYRIEREVLDILKK